jgi:hypothetical protein
VSAGDTAGNARSVLDVVGVVGGVDAGMDAGVGFGEADVAIDAVGADASGVAGLGRLAQNVRRWSLRGPSGLADQRGVCSAAARCAHQDVRIAVINGVVGVTNRAHPQVLA